MDLAIFRTRLRRAIFDEDVRIEVMSVKRTGGYIEITATNLIGYSDEATEDWTKVLADFDTYNDLIYSVSAYTGWEIIKAQECVGSNGLEMLKTSKRSVTSELSLYAKHFFTNDVLDDITEQAILVYNDALNTVFTSGNFPDVKTPSLQWISASSVLMIRAVQDTVSFYEYEKSGQITSVSLGGDLSISKSDIKTDDKSQLSWKSIADWYDKKWQTYLKQSADAGVFSEIQENELVRVKLESGALPYMLDQGIDLTVNFTAIQDGEIVNLVWDKVFNTQFAHYRLYCDDVEIDRIYDNQLVTYSHTPGVGAHFYEIAIYNKNNLSRGKTSVSITL